MDPESDCILDYYSKWSFVYDNKIWYYYSYYTAFVSVLYVQDLWSCFGFNVITIFLPDLVVLHILALGYSTGVLSADPARCLFLMLCTILGMSAGLWFISIMKVPRAIRSPHSELEKFKVEYKDIFITTYTMNKSHLLHFKRAKMKYMLQLLFLDGISYISIFTISVKDGERITLNDQLLTVDNERSWFRIDWTIYLFVNLIVILIFYFWNYTTSLEKVVLWKRNFKNYKETYFYWAIAFILMVLPGMVIWTSPAILLLIGAGANYIFLLVLSIIKRTKCSMKQKSRYKYN